ncbi:hypothetical protein T03_13071 [Trichinella britovi]|uniref:Uncharacterized protein n=1 Tax=Trichinella britovi TaxID=45882 RepID=A0A0V1D154_TRIBR|nr:hypothetical protein T03_13071 [Trichinella britovi]
MCMDFPAIFAHLKKFMQTSFETTFNSNFQSPTTATYAALLKHYMLIQVQFSLCWSHENKLSHIAFIVFHINTPQRIVLQLFNN